MITFEEFFATAREVADIQDELDFRYDEGVMPGYVFADCCYIEDSESSDEYMLILHNEYWNEPRTPEGLEKLAKILYENFYVFEYGD